MSYRYQIADLFEIVAQAVPDHLAIIQPDRRLTYAELNERADGLADHLQRQGIKRGDNIGLQIVNTSEYLEAFLAACKLGATPVNINYRYVHDELIYLYGNACLSAVLYTASLEERVQEALAECPEVKFTLATGSVWEKALEDSSRPDAAQRSEDDLILLYTGGTTGFPKGVMWSHRAMFFGALGGGGLYRAEGPVSCPEELGEVARASHPLRYLALPPLMHGAALWATLASLFAGQTVVLRNDDHFNPQDVWDLVDREQINIISVVGDAHAQPLLSALLDHPNRWSLASVMHLGSGGGLFSAHVQEGLRAHLPNGRVADSIGSSEGGIFGSGARPTSGDGFIQLPPHPDLLVMTDNFTRVAKTDELGTLVRCGHVPKGYFGDPEKSAHTFFHFKGRDCVNTGDMARYQEDGSIVVLGRGSQCINSGGEKVFPEEVEEVILRHPDIEDALVIGIADPRWGQTVNAVVKARPEIVSELEEQDLQDFCRRYLASYKVPKTIRVVHNIQRSPVGKADYRWARNQFETSNTSMEHQT